MIDDRPYVWPNEGRLDNDGTVWYACDPYPTWFYWTEDSKLITTDERSIYYEGETLTRFPGWVSTSIGVSNG